MKRYVVTLEEQERAELAEITRKGSHQSQKVVNALILLNCDEGEFEARLVALSCGAPPEGCCFPN